ncbi:MAG: hypothetical protein ACE361_25345 [Aureliella sp.]
MIQPVAPRTTDELSAPERRLLSACQQVRFGSLFGVVICDGQPVFDPAPRMRRNLRLNEKSIFPQPKPTSFALKDKHRLLIQVIRDMDSGTIDKIEVRDGLPEVICIESEVA